jgi:hypothetical protein
MLGCFAVAYACGSEGTPTDGGADSPTADAGGDGGDGAVACVADDLPCVAPDVCVGDCRGASCCGGFCPGKSVCASANVDFNATCPAACGGDPRGTWKLVGGCNTCDGGRGAIAADGLLTVSDDAGAVTDISEVSYDYFCDGYFNSGGGFGLGGSDVPGIWSMDAGTVGGSPYCVESDGGVLWILRNGTPWALKLTR